MLKAIKKIKGLGVYGDYSQPAGTAEFGIKNLIYGWNYSGKTTLSRLFAHLERGDYDPDIGGYPKDRYGPELAFVRLERMSQISL